MLLLFLPLLFPLLEAVAEAAGVVRVAGVVLHEVEQVEEDGLKRA